MYMEHYKLIVPWEMWLYIQYVIYKYNLVMRISCEIALIRML